MHRFDEGPPRAAPRHFPYLDHRTMAEVMRDETRRIDLSRAPSGMEALADSWRRSA